MPPDRWFRCFQYSAERHSQLICFPHAGGSASYYFPISRMLAPRVETLAVQYPGRQDRRGEPLIDDAHELADRIAGELKPDRPFALFGHSMGAVLAFEVARRLEAAGSTPHRLFVSGRRAPSAPRETAVHRLDDAGLVAELRRMAGTDQRFLNDPELLATIIPVVRNDYKLIETYQPQADASLRCPITVLVGDHDPLTTLAEAAAWRDHTTGEFDLEAMPGGHFYLEDRATEIADLISAALDQVHTIGGMAS